MNPPTPQGADDFAEAITWLWIFGLSLLGGFVSFYRKLREKHVRAWNFTEFIGEIVTSALVGIITFNLCQWLGYPLSLSAALVGITSHMGSRALFKFEKALDAKFPQTKEPTDDHPKNH